MLFFTYMHFPSARRAFTLIELLVVIAIIAILAVVVVLTLNPAQLLKESRDANRLSDAATLKNALSIYSEDVGGNLGSSSVAYISIPDPAATSTAGDQCQGLGLPAAASSTYHCASSSTFRNTNGIGWIPVNFASTSIGSPISSLPVDPINTTSSGEFYTYETNGTQWETTMALESSKYISTEASDGGPYTDLYEQGTNLALAPADFYANANINPSLLSFSSPKSVSGSVTSTYTFSGTAGQIINLGIIGINSCYTNYYILKPDGSTLTINFSCGSTLAFENYTLPTSGVYTLRVNPAAALANVWALTTSIVGTINSGSPVVVSSTLPGQTAAITFSGTATQVFSLAITGINSCYTNYYILKPDGSTLANNFSCGSSLTFTSTTLPTTGTYTISIITTSAAPSNNTLSLTVQ